jgi:radical SAM protein with 4Fe4S-binding SPASM domain
MVELGYEEINANVVYEKGWTLDHAKQYYKELKKLADYWIDNNLVDTHYLALFVDTFFRPKPETDLDNWCGGTGVMLSMDPDGYLYPCIRYMESSLGDDVEPLRIGHVDEGIGQTECTKDCIHCLNAITRRSQSTDECFYCPIAEGCSWCSAYNYQENGTADCRVTYICDMHKARALANVYFWNTWFKKQNQPKRHKMWIPEEWALEIVDKDEYEMLKSLQEDCDNGQFQIVNDKQVYYDTISEETDNENNDNEEESLVEKEEDDENESDIE